MYTAGRTAAAVGVAALVSLALAAPALAEAPFAMSDRVVDASSEQVAAAELDQLIAAADRVVAETDYDLWTVYVDSFDGERAVDWANETAISSNANSDVLLLAIAVDDGEAALSVAEEAALSDADISDIEAAARQHLRSGEWVQASLAAAEMTIEVSTATPATQGGSEESSAGSGSSGSSEGSGNSEGSGGSAGWVIGLVVLGVVVALVVVGVRRARRPGRDQKPQQQQPEPGPEQQWAGVSTAELGKRVGSALVALDNDVRSSANELAFAEAQFGIEATRAFKATLAQAQQQLAQAFAIQQQLGEQQQRPEAERRKGLIEILLLCQAADEALDSRTEELAELRSLQDRAPEVLDELEQRAGELAARLPAARDSLNQLRATYPATALATVAKAPDQADALLASARQSITEGRSRVRADDRGTAVAFARTAEDALQQVGTLLEMVAHAGTTLTNARSSLDDAIASLTSDVSDAGRLAPGDPTITPVVQRAQEALRVGSAATNGGDPIAALSGLTAAEQALDAALAPRREAEQVNARAASTLAGQISAAEATVNQANAFIETNRGVVSAAARTRLAAAAESLARAHRLRTSDVSGATTAARAAADGATSALQLAENDVRGWQRSQEGSIGGGYYGRSGGIDAGSLLLGGILNEVLGGNRRQSPWGGGSSWDSGSSRSSTPWGGGSRSGGGWGGTRSGGGRTSMSRSMGSIGRSSSRRSGGGSRRSGGGRRR